MSELAIVNFYKFVPIEAPLVLRESLRAAALERGLLGTVLLAPEGINAGLCGDSAALDSFLRWLRLDPRFSDVVPKQTFGTFAPFERLLVKVKRWIIRFAEDQDPNVDEIHAAPRLSPQDLRTLLADRPKDVILVDTRNRYEVDFGTFNGAATLPIDAFSEFPHAFDAAYGDQKDKTFVFFCTGGVRCEKSTPWAIARGYKNAVQLDGGILKYFEECADEGWTGQCFVFDNRWTLNGAREHVLPVAPQSSDGEAQLIAAQEAALAKGRPSKRQAGPGLKALQGQARSVTA